MENAVIVEGLGKQYRSYHHNRPYTIMAVALSGWRYLQPKERYWALQDLSFQVAPGEMLGVIGRNGAGKSTLLKVMGGILAADRGKIRIKGRIGSLLTLGSSFHTDLTGRENALINGIIAGLTRREMVRCMSQVIEFAELEAVIDNPVRTYSTGMIMRLAFSVAIHTNPKVMLVDEFLSVGDNAFQRKCLARIDELKAQGTAIVLVSHNVEQIAEMCDRTLWLQQGRIQAYGNAKTVVRQYLEVMTASSSQGSSGTGEVFISQVQMQNRRGESLSIINNSDRLIIVIDYEYASAAIECLLEISISDQHGKNCFASSFAVAPKTNLPSRLRLDIKRLDLNGGEYYIDADIYSRDRQQVYHRASQICCLTVETTTENKGLFAPPYQWFEECAPSK